MGQSHDESMNIKIPKLSLVLLIGPSGSGKSTFARRHFRPTEILSSDACRGMVSDDENDQAVTKDAFEVLRFIAGKRLALGRLTVIDATNVQPKARRNLLALALRNSVPAVGIVLNLPLAVCLARNQSRPDRRVSPEVVEKQTADLAASLPGLVQEGFQDLYVMDNPVDIDSARVLKKVFPMRNPFGTG